MLYMSRIGLMLGVVVACVGCDQVTKAMARATLRSTAPMPLFYEIVTLSYAENPGGFLSFGAHFSETVRFVMFTVAVGCALLVGGMALVRLHGLRTLQRLSLALSLGGGLGNLIDRLGNQGKVIDFLSLGFGPFQTGVFNVADVAVTVGVITFVLSTCWPHRARPAAV